MHSSAERDKNMKSLQMEGNPDCYLCGKPGELLYQNLNDRLFGVAGQFNIKLCKPCELLWMDPRPSSKDIAKCYENYYTHEEPIAVQPYSNHRYLASLRDSLRNIILCGCYGYQHLHSWHYFCWLGPALANISVLKRRATFHLRERFLPYNNHENGLILDIGCGRGDYLKQMKGLGWNVLGIEPDAASAQLAKRGGVNIFNGTLDEADLDEESVDQITMQHVIEHLIDPLAYVKECHRMLKKGGRLVIYTPNLDSLGHRKFHKSWLALDPPRHLYIFSPQSLKSLFDKSPFRKYQINTSPHLAKQIYDNSLIISKHGSVKGNATPQKGRTLFSVLEKVICLLGVSGGEDIEAVAWKD